jgi:hypothetical protein
MLYQKYKDQGFMVITLLTENYEAIAPNKDELNVWADEYGQTFPVVSDGERYIHTYGAKGKNEVKLPFSVLLGPGAELLVVNKDVVEADVVAALAAIQSND